MTLLAPNISFACAVRPGPSDRHKPSPPVTFLVSLLTHKHPDCRECDDDDVLDQVRAG